MAAMKNQLLCLGLGAGLALSTASMSMAVAPAPITQNSKVAWSTVVSDRFDGKVVYDKNFDPGGKYTFVSSWSPQGIRATYTEFFSEVTGYRTVWRTKWVKHGNKKREVQYPEQEPIYRHYSRDRSPSAIKFAFNNQIYTYDDGPVTPELATALVSAPTGNITIRLVWENGGSTDMEIGRGTVAAWKEIFAGVKASPTAQQPTLNPQLADLVVFLDRQGQLSIDGRFLTDTMLTTRIVDYLQQYPQGTVVLQPDKQATYQQVVQTLDRMRSIGRDRVRLAAE